MPPTDDGRPPEGLVTESGTPNAPAPVDLTAEGDRLVEVKVDGVKKQVPLKDAVGDFGMRQRMLKATDEAAELRRRVEVLDNLEEQLKTDPSGMLQRMAQHYQVDLGGHTPGEGGEEVDPAMAQLQAQLAEVQRQLQAQTQQFQTDKSQRALNGRLDELAASEGDKFDRDSVLAYAAANNISDIEHAYKMWRFDSMSVNGDNGASSETVGQTSAQLGQVSSGAGRNTPPPPDSSLKPVSSPMEAIERALGQQGSSLAEFMAN